MPGRSPKAGMVLAFTGHYDTARFLHRFLTLAGVEVVTSGKTTSRVLEAGSALASSDYCFPLRSYVGHVKRLLERHPDLDFLITPNIRSEDGGKTVTCSKYRDVGGIAIRSLGGMIAYLDGHGSEKADRSSVPVVLQPDIDSWDPAHLRTVCYRLYADLHRLPRLADDLYFLSPAWTAHQKRVRTAFDQAWEERQDHSPRAAEILADPTRPVLAVVGRRYLVHDPLLTADLKPWFEKQGVAVVTAEDVPFEELAPFYERVDGYYDTHRLGQAFLDWARERVDGAVVLGSYGCHPDAFQVDYLADHARTLGLTAWTFRFDELSGRAGFETRFETILHFLASRRDARLRQEAPAPSPQDVPAAAPAANSLPPLFVWPHMGEILDLTVEEIFHQLGLQETLRAPKTVDEEDIRLGNIRFTESCSPYALSTGSLIKGIRDAVADLREEAERQGRPVEPRRIVALMVRGYDPCSFGWYSLAQQAYLASDARPLVEADGHTVEMLTVGLEQSVQLLRSLAGLGNSRLLAPLLEYLEAQAEGRDLSTAQQLRYKTWMTMTITRLARVVLAKIDAAEALRAQWLLRRVHEGQPGQTRALYRESLTALREVHALREIRQVRDRFQRRMQAEVPLQGRRPRVVVVGEIYLVLTSYANRGVVENLLAREGIEVVEAVKLSGFIRATLRDMTWRATLSAPVVGQGLRALSLRGFPNLTRPVRSKSALPLITREVGGEGLPSVGHARDWVEEGVDGILHLYPLKCMPEGIAKDALKEAAGHYGVPYLSLTFDKETDIERLKTELRTFATVLRAEAEEDSPSRNAHRRDLGRQLERMYHRYRRQYRSG